MDSLTLSKISAMRQQVPALDELVTQHQTLDERVTDLQARDHLTGEEAVELARLKKEKLHIKDRIEALLH